MTSVQSTVCGHGKVPSLCGLVLKLRLILWFLPVSEHQPGDQELDSLHHANTPQAGAGTNVGFALLIRGCRWPGHGRFVARIL